MTVKALKTQLMAAIAMTLVAAVALGSSTFAWFAANTTVTAQGMSIAAQSDTVLLEIKGKATAGFSTTSDTEFSTTGTLEMTNVKVYPVHHDSLSALTDITTAANWWYGYSDSVSASTLNNATKTTLGGGDTLTDYVVAVEYEVKLNDKSGLNTAYDLYVKDITLPTDTGITAIVAGADRFSEHNATASNIAQVNQVAISNTVTKTAQTVTVYLYIDGENTNVYTDNIARLTGSISMVLGCYTSDTLNAA